MGMMMHRSLRLRKLSKAEEPKRDERPALQPTEEKKVEEKPTRGRKKQTN